MTSATAGPKYLSVREHLRRRVSALPEHTLLPPEPVLCAEYGVSRITLRRAVDGLVADEVVELVRLRSVDGAPNHVAHSFLPAALYPTAAEADLSQGSLYEYLRREHAADLAHARIVVDVGTAAPDEADLLRVVAGSPLLVVRTTVRDTGGHPLVHSFSRLRPDVSQVEFEVSVGGR